MVSLGLARNFIGQFLKEYCKNEFWIGIKRSWIHIVHKCSSFDKFKKVIKLIMCLVFCVMFVCNALCIILRILTDEFLEGILHCRCIHLCSDLYCWSSLLQNKNGNQKVWQFSREIIHIDSKEFLQTVVYDSQILLTLSTVKKWARIPLMYLIIWNRWDTETIAEIDRG